MLRVLEGWNTFENLKSQISDVTQRVEKISTQLYGWIESLKDSEISGQRHLGDEAKTAYTGKMDRESFLKELQSINEASAKQRTQTIKPDIKR